MSIDSFQERIKKGPVYTTDLGVQVIPCMVPRFSIYYRFISVEINTFVNPNGCDVILYCLKRSNGTMEVIEIDCIKDGKKISLDPIEQRLIDRLFKDQILRLVEPQVEQKGEDSKPLAVNGTDARVSNDTGAANGYLNSSLKHRTVPNDHGETEFEKLLKW